MLDGRAIDSGLAGDGDFDAGGPDLPWDVVEAGLLDRSDKPGIGVMGDRCGTVDPSDPDAG
jgi:hypothetical protein